MEQKVKKEMTAFEQGSNGPQGSCPYVKPKDSHRTLLDSHLSCRHSRPRRHTSSPEVCKECCCTGTHPGGSVYPLNNDCEKGEKRNDSYVRSAAKCIHIFSMTHLVMCVSLTTTVTFLFIAAIHTVSISITAPADGDAMAIFALELITVALHITAILDQSKEFLLLAPWYVIFQSTVLNQEGSGLVIPHLNHQHNRGPRRTSSARRCNGRLCKQTRSLNTDEALRTERTQLRRAREDH